MIASSKTTWTHGRLREAPIPPRRPALTRLASGLWAPTPRALELAVADYLDARDALDGLGPWSLANVVAVRRAFAEYAFAERDLRFLLLGLLARRSGLFRVGGHLVGLARRFEGVRRLTVSPIGEEVTA